MGNNKITRERSGLTVSQVGSNDVYKMHGQIQDIVEMAGFGEDYSHFFAKAVENGRTIDWHPNLEGEVQQVSTLPDDERAKALEQFRTMTKRLQAYAAKLKEKSGYRAYADILDKALIVPDINSLYLVGGKPVLTDWGLSKCDTSMVDSGDIVAMLETEINNGKGPVLPPDPGPDPNDNTNETGTENTNTGETPPAEPPTDDKNNNNDDGPTPPPSGDPTSGSFPTKMIFLLVLLAIAAVAAWFWLNKGTKSENDMSFLKPNIEVAGVLEDANGKPVNLNMKFPDGDGIGKAYINAEDNGVAPCEGSATASLEGENVFFKIEELICPNNDNYEPFMITCPRKGSKNCVGSNDRGQNWTVEIEILK